MRTVRAIQTRYAGITFRSRVEARWARFFDAIGIRWEYEREGFVLPCGPYLPDFWLPDFEIWAEVKGQEFIEAETQRCAELAELTGQAVLMLPGPPAFRVYEYFYRDEETGEVFLGETYLTRESLRERESFDLTAPPRGLDEYGLRQDERYCAAVSAALSERFEKR